MHNGRQIVNKPKLSITITSLDDNTITKTYTKANGLTSLTINGLSNELPYYGIISRTGTVEITDNEGWLKEQSDANVLPEIGIEVKIDGITLYEFVADNNISYSKLDKRVTINLIDTIQNLQDKKIDANLQYTNTTAYNIFIDMCSILGIEATINTATTNYLKNILIDKVIIEKDYMWNILTQFVYATRCLFYREGKSYILRRVEE